jgi:hypothetical protein
VEGTTKYKNVVKMFRINAVIVVGNIGQHMEGVKDYVTGNLVEQIGRNIRK